MPLLSLTQKKERTNLFFYVATFFFESIKIQNVLLQPNRPKGAHKFKKKNKSKRIKANRFEYN